MDYGAKHFFARSGAFLAPYFSHRACFVALVSSARIVVQCHAGKVAVSPGLLAHLKYKVALLRLRMQNVSDKG
jgi:hypothetical protein